MNIILYFQSKLDGNFPHKTMNQNEIRWRNPTVVRREGRITAAQRAALTEMLPLYRVPEQDIPLKFDKLFPQANRIAIEIGFGDGEALFKRAQRSPETGYLGIEVYRPGIGRLLHQLRQHKLDNLRIADRDARDVMEFAVEPSTIDELSVLFPDPWPKKRHFKRRLMQPEFCQLCADRLKPGGRLLFASDWENYAQQVVATCGGISALKAVRADAEDREQTRYERKAVREGRKIFNLAFEKLP